MREKEITETNKASVREVNTIVDSNDEFIYLGEGVEDFFRYSREKLQQMVGHDLLTEKSHESGRKFGKALHEPMEIKTEMVRGDGSRCLVNLKTVPIVYKGDDCIECTVELLEEIETKQQTVDASDCKSSKLDSEKCEIAKNIRIETPNGPESLRNVVLDLMQGHSEVEQYRRGALTLCEAIDQRLAEEQNRNPDSIESKVLEESKEIAHNLRDKIDSPNE